MLISTKHIASAAFCLFMVVILECNHAYAQHDASRMFKKYTTKDGLLNNGIYSLQRSKNGMWWIATGGGLQRFDGYTFEAWNKLPDSSDKLTPASQIVHEDDNGNIWIANLTESYVARKGSNYFKKTTTETSKNIPHPDYLIYPALEDKERMWFYQGNKGFYGFNKSTTKLDTLISVKFKEADNQALKNLPSIAEINNKVVWATMDFEDSSYVVRFIPGKPLLKKSFSNREYGQIKAIIPVNEEDVLFISTRYTAICKIDQLEKPEKILTNENIPGNYIRGFPYERLKVYNKGSIIFPGSHGIYEFDPSQQTLKPYSTSAYPEINLSRQLMFSLKEDDWGNVWIGRDGSDGLLVYYPGKLKFEFLHAPSQYFNLVYSLAATKDGTVYASNFQKGINLFDRKGNWQKHITLPNVENGLSPSIRAIQVFNQRELILKSLYGKVFILDINTHTLTDISSRIPDKVSKHYLDAIFDANIYPINENKAHYTHGKYIVQVSSTRHDYKIEAIDSLPHSKAINSITYTSNGTRIVGTVGGIYIKEKNWMFIKESESFPVKYITVDNQDAIWAAGPQGILVIKDKKIIKKYNEANGLINQFVYGILFDEMGNAWYSSNRGLGCIHKDGSTTFYTEADGLQGDEFDTQSFWKSADGKKLYFGGIYGITAFKPSDVLQNTKAGEVQLSSIQVNDKQYADNNRIENINSLDLPHDQNAITFNFTLTNFTDPAYNVFQVKLDGANNQWINLKNTHNMRYLLAPGNYTLHIKGSSDGSHWSAEKLMRINIRPAWWQTNLFRWSIALVLISLTGFAGWYYNKVKTKELKRALALEVEMQKERERISRDLHDHIGAYSTALIANADKLEQQVQDEKVLKTVTYLKENSKNILATLRETIWLLNSNNLTVKRFFEGFINYSTNILRNHEGIEIEFSDDITNHVQLAPAKAIHLLRILQEAIQNIIKHAQATRINCTLTCKEKLTITISDNGKGFDFKSINKGNGLYNMQQRAEEINFSLTINSEKDKGTTIIINGLV